MQLLSWNVNGIRSIIRKGMNEWLESCDADIICIQESRALPEQVDWEPDGYHAIWNPAEKKGYSGTLTYSREKPVSVQHGIGIPEHGTEGRVLTCEYKNWYLVNMYVPNSKRDLSRLPYRQQWDRDVLSYFNALEKKKPVIFCGDLNVAHTEDDLARPKSNKKTHGFTPEERQGFTNFVEAGFIDTFRVFTEGNGHYSWWSNMNNARERNVGWRIDYFCLSESLQPRLHSSEILPEITGSDHCPVRIEIDA